MVSVSPLLLCFSLLMSTVPFISSNSITIPLSNSLKNQNPIQDSFQKLNHLVSTSLSRAHHLKNPQTTTSTAKTPLFPHSYGGYSIPLSFGTPPQTLSFVMDTGSSFVWFPCTSHYICKNCSFSSSPALKIPTFIPRMSSSSKIIGCKNPKCAWIHHTNLQCLDCRPGGNCSQICPPYMILYGSGTTGGITLSETIHINKLSVPNFLVGCSIASSRQPAGIAGFGRGLSSLPSQLGVSKFSYCLVSHRFDDTERSSSMALDLKSDSDNKTSNVAYTPFVKNPKVAERPAFSVYYYVGLRRISVGGKHVKIPYKYLAPGTDGNGGTIIDSGTTFTYMARDVFEPVSDEFIAQMKKGKKYRRDMDVETLTGLRPCFNVSGETRGLKFPELTLHFKGGADVTLPVENYFAFVDSSGSAVCLTLLTNGALGPDVEVGPGIILGNFQLQNFYVEYDLENERLGFKQQKCG